MSNQTRQWKKPIGKSKIVDRFYIEAFESDFYPNGVLRLYRVTRGSIKPRPSPFYYQSVRIKNPEELANVKPVLDYLAGKLRWQELPPLLEALEEQLRKEEAIDPEIQRIVRQYPKASIGMLKAFDTVYHGEVEIEDFPLISEYMRTALESLLGKQEIMINLQLDLIDKLGKEKTPEGMQKLIKLLGEYDLPQLTSVASIITDRLQRLRVFGVQIQNEKAYEITGPNSIHNQLANALWILDDSYWLLHSNEPLTHLLNKEYKLATEDERLRPDFICANDKDNLVIIEIKKPSQKVRRKDINQLQDYLVAVDRFYQPKFKSKQGFLIAKGISLHHQQVIDMIESIQFKSYNRLVQDCKRRYQEYIDALQRKKE